MLLLFLLLVSLSTGARANYCHDEEEVCLWFSRCHNKEPFTAVREKQELDEICQESFKVNQATTDVAVRIRPEGPYDWHFDIFLRDYDETALEFGENRLEFVNASLALFHLLNDTIVEEINIPMEAHAKVKKAARTNFTLSLNQTLISIFDGSVVRYTKINGTVAKYSEQEIWERMKDFLWDQAHPPTSIPPDVEKPTSIKVAFSIIMGILWLIILLAVAYFLYRKMQDQKAANESYRTKKVFEQPFKTASTIA